MYLGEAIWNEYINKNAGLKLIFIVDNKSCLFNA